MESSQLPVTITVCISVNICCCKHYISLCYSFLALQSDNTYKYINVTHLSSKKTTKTTQQTKLYTGQDQQEPAPVTSTQFVNQLIHYKGDGARADKQSRRVAKSYG